MPSDPCPVIRLRGAALGYGGNAVLRGVDLEILSGSFWFLLGPNGSGKTTILRAILGLLSPLAGDVWRHPEHARLERIGFVPQRCAINPALPTTVREFVSLGALGSHLSPDSHVANLRWALDRVALGGMQERDYWSLSGGQRQRALVARALVRRPDVLLFDEPTEGLDADSEEGFLRTLDELHREHAATLVLVTHRLELAKRHATHIASVRAGQVRAGTRSEALGAAP